MGVVLAFRPRANRTSVRGRRPTRPVPRPNDDPLWRDLVGRVLRETRATRNETLRVVADRAGVSVQYLSEIERGRKEPSSEMLAAVCGALDLPLADLAQTLADRLIQSSRRPSGPVALAA